MTSVPETADGPDATLGRRAARGAMVSMSGQVARFSLQMAGLVILARLLTPEDYGIVAIVLVLVGIGEIVRDFGLSTAAVQSRTLSAEQRSNLFWVNSSIGLGLAVLLFAAAVPVAGFFDEPRLVGVVRAMAATFVLTGVATQFRADLVRALRFAAVTTAEVVSLTVGIVAATAVALAGGGYWALVTQQLVQAATALVLVATVSGRAPGRPRRGVPMGGLYRYGWNLMGSQLIGYVTKSLPAVIIGRVHGVAPLGAFNRASQLVVLPLDQINAPLTVVATPVLSRLQDDPPRYQEYVLRGQTILLHVCVAGLAFAVLFADVIVEVFLGAQWSAATPLLRVLAVAGCFQAASYATYWVFLTKGLTSAQLQFSLVSRLFMLLLLLLAAPFDVLAVVVAYAAATALTWPFALWWIARVSNAPARAMFGNGVRVLAVYTATALAGAVAGWLTPPLAPTADVLVRLAGALLMYGVLLVALRSLRHDIRSSIEAAALGARRERRSASPPDTSRTTTEAPV